MSKSNIEKLGIPNLPWKVDYDEVDDISTEMNNVWLATIAEREHTRLFMASREMLEALIDMHIHACETCSADYEANESLIEKATGRTWAEVTDSLNG